MVLRPSSSVLGFQKSLPSSYDGWTGTNIRWYTTANDPRNGAFPLTKPWTSWSCGATVGSSFLWVRFFPLRFRKTLFQAFIPCPAICPDFRTGTDMAVHEFPKVFLTGRLRSPGRTYGKPPGLSFQWPLPRSSFCPRCGQWLPRPVRPLKTRLLLLSLQR